MNRNMIETIMGAVVLAVAGGFLAFAYQNSGMSPVEGYRLKAVFKSAAGIATGSDVRIGGIKIGVVSDMKLEPQSYQAIAELSIKDTTTIPDDSSAAIVSDGLLGSKYIEIQPGGSDMMLKNGGTIDFTQSSVNLESLIGKFMFSGGGVDSDDGKEKQKPAGNAAVPTLE